MVGSGERGTTRHGDSREFRDIWCQNIKLFGRSRTCSIDFSQLGPMFRLNAALDRNAIPWFAARLRKSEPPAS
jgi:hypothetical protein